MDKVSDVAVLETIVKAIVSKPEAVKIERNVDERGVLLTLYVDPQDMGQLIGRRGATIQAIRTILRIVGARNQARVNIKVPASEPAGSQTKEATDVDKALDDLKL